MYEVNVYDSSGNLKKVISEKSLNIRSKEQVDSPHLFRKNKKHGRITKPGPKVKTDLEIPYT